MKRNSRAWQMLMLAKPENIAAEYDPGEGTSSSFALEEPKNTATATCEMLDLSSDDSVKDAPYNIESDNDLSSDEDVEFNENDAIVEEKSASGSRWKKACPEKWKKNINKEMRSKCLPYKDFKGNLREAKKPKIIANNKCRFECSSFNEETRLKLCKNFWGLSYVEQKNFILNTVESQSPKCRRPRNIGSKLRKSAKKYFFFKDLKKIRVCQDFFLSTLNISNGVVFKAFCGQNTAGGQYSLVDKRGKNEPTNKTKPEDIKNIKNHIESFPCMESHYCRKGSKKKYLDSKLSIRKMHTLYKSYCTEKNINSVGEITYRRIFCNDYNLSFFIPKKDQCLVCNKYKIASPDGKTNIQTDYDNHLKRKMEAFHEKMSDKERARLNSNFKSISMDMQSVLQIPSTDVSLTYYKRKLVLHNFTIYEAALPNNAFCYAWTEINGKGGSCEVASSILKYIQQLPANVEELSLFSVTCAGQNRNVNIVAFFLNVVQVTNLTIVEQKFMETGHSYMEVDSMHSAIEKQKRYFPIYCANDWINLFKCARVRVKNKSPYQAIELKYIDFYDIKNLAGKLIRNKVIDSNGEKVNWLKVKCFRYEKAKPFILQYKYNFQDSFKFINVLHKRRGRHPTNSFLEIKDIPKLYHEPLPISSQKKHDLMELCRKGVVPEIFHVWFSSLPSNNNIKDRLPEPDAGEESSEDEE